MQINQLVNRVTPEAFFGVKNAVDMQNYGNLNVYLLFKIMQEKFKIANLSNVNFDSFSDPFLNFALKTLKEHNLAKLTLENNRFRELNKVGRLDTHTIGLVVNKNPNMYFYNEPPQVLILDSLGEKSEFMKDIHKKLENDFIKKIFPNAEVITNVEPQQIDGSQSCFNWTMANLKVASENLGRTDILCKLPKSHEIETILAQQQLMCKNYQNEIPKNSKISRLF